MSEEGVASGSDRALIAGTATDATGCTYNGVATTRHGGAGATTRWSYSR